jgi:hypothetical protein
MPIDRLRLRLETSAARVRVPMGGSRSCHVRACDALRNRIAAIGSGEAVG